MEHYLKPKDRFEFLFVALLVFAVQPLNIERAVALTRDYEPEHINSISPSDVGKHLPGDSFGAGQVAAPRNVVPDNLDLSRAIQLAVAWHPAIAESIGQLYQQHDNVTIARAGYYPQIRGGFNSGYDSGLTGNGQSQTFTLSVSQMLYDFGKVDSAVDSAVARVNGQQAAVLLAIDQVARDTAFAMIELQRYQALLDISRAQVKGLTAIAELAQQRSDMGASTRSDMIQARSRVEAAIATQLQYTALYKRWRTALGNLLGTQAPVSVSTAMPAALRQSCQGIDADQVLTPSLLIAQAQQADAQAQIALARAEGLPTVSLDPSLTQYLDSNDENGTVGGRDRTRYGIFINVEVPLYQGGAITARKSAAAQALRAAEAANDAARLAVRQGLLEARDQTSSLEQRLSTLDFRERSISETRDLYRQQYLELGTRPLLDLLNAEQEIHQAAMDRANTRADLHRLEIECLYNSSALRTAFNLDSSTIQGVEIRP
ncbi:TolC family outer membrane protein [Pseudomonas guariconensis]|uniref:TolC family outer membrane protein n=1 Tax=Pseudomonas TaxID=286 RepID=UPI0020984DDE|nr:MULTISPECIES: TolC family outer membrane protein [Pseudomonas]MCO7517340.1 TolC family outer membrane protein [Pseudomonas putida]MCO7605768.1 TolC family outer membrane protein [Pseudomonas guariconensis]